MATFCYITTSTRMDSLRREIAALERDIPTTVAGWWCSGDPYAELESRKAELLALETVEETRRRQAKRAARRKHGAFWKAIDEAAARARTRNGAYSE